MSEKSMLWWAKLTSVGLITAALSVILLAPKENVRPAARRKPGDGVVGAVFGGGRGAVFADLSGRGCGSS